MKPSCKTLSIGIILFLACGSCVHADDVYVSNTSAGTITQIDSNGNSSIFAYGLNSPEGLAFDGSGNLYVADSGDGTISEINPSGNVSVFASGLNSPAALAFDPNGNLYVATPGDQTILKINSSRDVSVFATGVAFDSDGAYLAADYGGNVYANTTRTVEKFGSNGNESQVFGAVNFVEGMAVDGNGNLYVALQNSGSISGNGSLQTSPLDYPAPFTVQPYGEGIFEDTPCDLSFDANGNLFATFSQMLESDNRTIVPAVLMQFGVNGNNSVVATGIGGTYLAIQSVPEPKMWTMLFMGFGALPVGCRFRRCLSSFTGRPGRVANATKMACKPRCGDESPAN